MTVKTPVDLHSLIDKYERHRAHYRSGSYNEAQLRVEFIDDLFIALEWDVRNDAGYAHAYKDVIHEDAIKIGTATKAPDYAFRVGGVRKFFLETKKPSVDITRDSEPAWQLRRYAWSAKLPLSILTNFEHLAVYDTRVRPSQSDPASTARVMLVHYTELLDRWSELERIFSLESIRMGSFDEYADSNRTKRGTAEVDEAFLADLEHWREMLARNIALRNNVTGSGGGVIPTDQPPVIPTPPHVIPTEAEESRTRPLTQRELNFAVQITIDRIIFLRICEDRGIEEYGRLEALTNGKDQYRRLQELYRQADERYNSGLFHFHPERDRPGEPDQLTTRLQIDDKVLKDIFKNLYYPYSPYEFSALPADILGQIYERFLGSVIRLTPGGRAAVEEKPEVRKAGGVYYTPTYIVDYIVEQTVGKLVEGKTPKQVAKLTILDPACGSGSFLIGAYQFLLDWHRDYYLGDGAEKHTKVIYQGSGGEWRLTTAERRRILLNNIYGVDIDQQAVEVTKLSLLLKVLEGESDESLNRQLQFVYRERALPDLRDNIKCGNSLIGPDFYQTVQLGLVGFDEEERYRINVFDWEAEFPQIMRGKKAGFDAVIGNPPWGAEFDNNQRKYLASKYEPVPSKTKDSYLYFIVQALQLLPIEGTLGFIVPNTWLLTNSAEEFRRTILSFEVTAIIDHGDGVFKKATVESSTLVLRKRPTQYNECIAIRLRKGVVVVDHVVNTDLWLEDPACRVIIELTEEKRKLSRRLQSISEAFVEQCTITWGIKPYQVGHGTPPQTREMMKNRIYHSSCQFDDTWKPLLVGSNVDRYQVRFPGNLYIKYGKWLMYPSNEQLMTRPKLLMRQTSDYLRVGFDDRNYYCQNSVFIVHSERIELRYLLAVLNSRLLNFIYKLLNPQIGKTFAEIKPSVIKQLPIRTIDFNDPADVERHDRMVSLVQQMLDLHQQRDAARTDQDKRYLQRLIDSIDNQIDQLVYELYDLTEEEIAIVEGEVG